MRHQDVSTSVRSVVRSRIISRSGYLNEELAAQPPGGAYGHVRTYNKPDVCRSGSALSLPSDIYRARYIVLDGTPRSRGELLLVAPTRTRRSSVSPSRNNMMVNVTSSHLGSAR